MKKTVSATFLVFIFLIQTVFMPVVVLPGTGAVSNGELVNLYSPQSYSASDEVLVGYMGVPRASWVLLFYDPSDWTFTFKYRVRNAGAYNQSQVIRSAVTGYFVAFSLYYENPDGSWTILKDKDKSDCKLSKKTTVPINEHKAFQLSGEPDWSRLKWNFVGLMWGKDYDAVQAEQQSENLEWIWETYEIVSTIIFIVATAYFAWQLYAAGAALAIIMAGTVVNGIKQLAVGVIEQWIYEKVQEELKNRAQEGYWNSIVLGVDNYISKNGPWKHQSTLSVAGKETGADTRDTWENRNGTYEEIEYIVDFKAYRINKIMAEFTTPQGGSKITDAYVEFWDVAEEPTFDLLPGWYSVSYSKEAYNSILGDDFYKLMKHNDDGQPYFEFRMHVFVDPEIIHSRENDPNWTLSYYVQSQNLKANLTVRAVEEPPWPYGLDYYSTSTTKELKITFVFFPYVRKKADSLIQTRYPVIYIVYGVIRTILAVIVYPPHQNPKHITAYPLPHIPGRGELAIDVDPDFRAITAPPPNLVLTAPNPSWRYIIWIPQIPEGGDWKITLAYDVDPFQNAQVIHNPSRYRYNLIVDVPSVDKKITLPAPPDVDDIMAITAKPPSTYGMAFIVPKMPGADETAVIDVSNPDNTLLLTARTTAAYPLTISLPDIPRTTYIKIPLSGELNLHVLNPSTPNPVIPTRNNGLGVFVDPGTTTSDFEFYSNIGKIRDYTVAYGSLNVPPSAVLTVVENAGLTWAENDTVPRVSATVTASIYVHIELIGHGVDLSYSHRTGTKNFKIIVTNIGVVQDTFDLNITKKPSGWTATLSRENVTLNSGESMEVDLTVTPAPGQTYPHRLVGPRTTSHMMGMDEDLFSDTYSVRVRATCRAVSTVSDTVKVPVGIATGFGADVTMGNTNVNGTSTFRDRFITLIGNLTVEPGGEATLDNVTVVVEESDGRRPIIRVLEGGFLNLTDTDVVSSEDGLPFDLEIIGTLVLKGKNKLRDAIVILRNNLEIGGGSRLFLSNSNMNVGNSTFTPTITVHNGSVIGLLNSSIQSFDPSFPYPLTGGGGLINFESQLADYMEYRFTLETPVYSQHIHQSEIAQYPINITNIGNQTDTVILHLEMTPDPEWNAQLNQLTFPLAPGETALTYLEVMPLVSTPTNKFLEVDVVGESTGDSEKIENLETYTTFVPTYPFEYLTYNNTDIFLSQPEPVEEETVNIAVIIHNDGDMPATNVNVTFYDNTTSTVIGAVNIPIIPARAREIASTSWTIEEASIHEVTAETNYPGGSVLDSTTFVVKNKPDGSSTATIAFDPPLIAYTGEPIYFDAFNCTDSDSDIIEFLWDFGDEATGFGPILVYTYQEDGNYTVTLRLVDSQGLTRTSTLEIMVLNRPPTAKLSITPTAAEANETMIFDASASFDYDGNITQYSWDFGNGNTTMGKMVTHSYREVGVYNVTLTVTDNDGSTDAKNASTAVFPPEKWEINFIEPEGYPIVDFAVYNGNLHAAADSKLYMYNGSSWDFIHVPTYVLSLEPYQDKLIVGGQGGLFSYNGSAFNLIFSISSYIKPLGVYNNTLFAGTVLDKPPTLYYCNGSADNPDNWHVDSSFSTILNFSGPFGSIDSFEAFNNRMYITTGNTVYSYNGTDWSIARTYDDVYAYLDMRVYNGKLYLATRDQAWRKPQYLNYSGFSGRVIEFDGNNWTAIFDHDYWIFSLETYNGELYVGTANEIYTYNGTDWSISFNALEGAYYAISFITFNNTIFAGMGNGHILVDPTSGRTSLENPIYPDTIGIPEFPSIVLLPLFMMATLLAAIVYVRKRAPANQFPRRRRT